MVIDTGTKTQEPYTLLRTALALYKKSPSALQAHELQQVQKQAQKEYEIETRVLSSAEAAAVIVPDRELQNAFNEIKQRYEDSTTFLADLELNKLSEQCLLDALNRQCKVNHILENVASKSPTISDVEIGIYYHSHSEKFHRSEQREASHILLSINPDFPENTRENALRKIQEITVKLQRKPHKFSDLALRYSECPTAMEGGKLGIVEKGKLYPELDKALFQLKTNAISDVLESELGFHVLRCLKIFPAHTISLKKATPKIRQLMQARYRRNCQREWLASLPASEATRHD